MYQKFFHNTIRQLILVSIAFILTAPAYADNGIVNDSTLTCNETSAFISENNWPQTDKFSPLYLEKEIKKCHLNSKTTLLLRDFFRYHKTMMERDFPNSMARSSGSDLNAIYNQDVKDLESILKEYKGADYNALSKILRFMAKQPQNRYTYAWAAYEIVARDFPNDYEGYKSLTLPGTEGRRAWEVTGKRWLKE